MKKIYKSSITNNHKIKKNIFYLMVFPQKATKPVKLFLDFAPKIKQSIVGKSSD